MTRLPVLGALLACLTIAAILIGVQILRHDGDPLASWWFRLTIAASVPAYLLAVRQVLRGHGFLPIIIGLAVVLRVALVLSPPMLSSDLYRYIWDGRVQHAGINPYLHVPAAPALADLRDEAIYPHISRADYAPTIYPPAAQILFAAINAVSPSGYELTAMKAAAALMDALTVLCLLRLLALAKRPAAYVLIYAWNPLVLWEFAGNAHVDAAATTLLILAIMLRAGGKYRDGWAGMVLGAAMLIKFLPAVAAPALWRRGPGGRWLVAGCIACVISLYGFYIVFDHAGLKVLGFLSAYGTEEGLDSGTGVWALAGLGLLTNLPAWAPKLYFGCVAIGLAALGSWIAFRPRPMLGQAADILRIGRDTGLLAATLMLTLSPHYAWYYGWLAALAVLAPSRALIWLSSAALLLYQNPFSDHFLWQALLYAPALVLAWRDLRTAPATPAIPVLQGSI